VARFHLHPGVRPSLIREGEGALLALPSGEVWAFEAAGLPIEVEESIFLASADGRHRSEQISISYDAVATPRIAWRLSRISGPAPRGSRAQVQPETELPLEPTRDA
jgi:uncharacterized heparinase superfamily protein